MNYAMLSEWEADGIDTLISFGTPRKDAERIMSWSRKEAERLSRDAENERQFLMEFRELGSRILAEREGKSQQAIRDKYNKLINKESMKVSFAHDLRAA